MPGHVAAAMRKVVAQASALQGPPPPLPGCTCTGGQGRRRSGRWRAGRWRARPSSLLASCVAATRRAGYTLNDGWKNLSRHVSSHRVFADVARQMRPSHALSLTRPGQGRSTPNEWRANRSRPPAHRPPTPWGARADAQAESRKHPARNCFSLCSFNPRAFLEEVHLLARRLGRDLGTAKAATRAAGKTC